MNVPSQPADVTIVRSEPSDLEGIEGFLRATFRPPANAQWCTANALRWKYFEHPAAPPLSYLARQGDRIVGHIGLVRRALDVPGGDRTLSGVHFIDWAVAPEARAAGALLMLRGLSGTDVAYLLGGSRDGRAVSQAAGFTPRPPVAVFGAVLRPWHRLGLDGAPRWRAVVAAIRDSLLRRRARHDPPRLTVALERVSAFDEQVVAILAARPRETVYSERSARLLDHYLRCPVAEIRGFLVRCDGRVVGVVMLSVVTREGVRQGRVVECLVASDSRDAWHATMYAAVAELARQEADIVSCYGSTELMAGACVAAGLRLERLQSFSVRDRAGLLPEAPVHITHLEADHAFF